MELRGLAKRLAEIAAVIGAGVAIYIAWSGDALDHRDYPSIGAAAGFIAVALWVILGWLGLARAPRIRLEDDERRDR